MIRASSRLQGGVKSQNQKNRNRHFSKPNGKVQSTYQDNNKQKQKSGSNQNNNPPGNFNLRKPQKSHQQPSKPSKAIITKKTLTLINLTIPKSKITSKMHVPGVEISPTKLVSIWLLNIGMVQFCLFYPKIREILILLCIN